MESVFTIKRILDCHLIPWIFEEKKYVSVLFISFITLLNHLFPLYENSLNSFILQMFDCHIVKIKILILVVVKL